MESQRNHRRTMSKNPFRMETAFCGSQFLSGEDVCIPSHSRSRWLRLLSFRVPNPQALFFACPFYQGRNHRQLFRIHGRTCAKSSRQPLFANRLRFPSDHSRSCEKISVEPQITGAKKIRRSKRVRQTYLFLDQVTSYFVYFP
jgi:hypothetical protein